MIRTEPADIKPSVEYYKTYLRIPISQKFACVFLEKFCSIVTCAVIDVAYDDFVFFNTLQVHYRPVFVV